MQARRAARELALILFSQFDKKITKYNDADFEDIILKSVRILTSNASDELKLAMGKLIEMREYIENLESNDPTNLERPIGASDKPVPLPLTSDLSGKLNDLTDVGEKALLAMEIAEFTILESQNDVKNYAVKLAETFKEHFEEIDENIQKFSKGWDIQRLVKMDKDILRIAIIELLYIKQAPMKVVVDEALELAKKYSTDDSASFVNGILAKVIIENGLS